MKLTATLHQYGFHRGQAALITTRAVVALTFCQPWLVKQITVGLTVIDR